MQCPQCAAQNRRGVRFCEDCGSPLSLACAGCGAEVVAGKRFCGACGAPLPGHSDDRAISSQIAAPNHSAEGVAAHSVAEAERGTESPLASGPPSGVAAPAAERRQLTVMFCDLVDSTVLAGRLDPEELREVVRAYQEVCAEAVGRFEGHVAQYLGDGLLVYFGHPLAHEDDARRAVRAGLEIVEEMKGLNERLRRDFGVSLSIRLGIHTGLVVVGEVGGGARREQLALGETPNVAARLQGLAEPDAVLISDATHRLVGGFFACEPLGAQILKGVSRPLELYRVMGESGARGRLEVAGTGGLTPLVGREQELGLLLDRWERVKDGLGQVVLLTGEAGIGKSRLIQELKGRLTGEPCLRWECHCSPFHQNSALYPVVDLFQRALQFGREDPPEEKLAKLEGAVDRYGLPSEEMVPLFASLLSVPLPERYPPLSLTPQRQKERTLEAVLELLLRLADEQPVLFIIEDLHWVDPSTLELLGLLVDQAATARTLILLTGRPEFRQPWDFRAHLSQLTLTRLPRTQAEAMVEQVAGAKALPAEVLRQVVAKTDGVPLFVEELTKTVLESGLLREREGSYELTDPLPPLAIPATLQDSLMARLDRLATAKEVAQLGAVLGRSFSYELLRAASQLDEATLQHGLARLVEAELLYQRGVLPQATFIFKHALIQETAYQSLLKTRRQQFHHRIAEVLARQFPETAGMQPQLLAHHYTEAGLVAQAIPYWQQAGQRAAERSANLEAISHLSRGLDLLTLMPEGSERARHELDLQVALGPALAATKGYGAPEVEQVHSRARELCQQVGETARLVPAVAGLWFFYHVRAEFRTALEQAAYLRTLAEREQDPALHLQAHFALGIDLFHIGELARAQAHLDEGVALYDPQWHRALVLRYGQDAGVSCRGYVRPLWLLGYPERALRRSQEAVALARELAHPFSLAFALNWAATVHQFRREVQATQEQAEALIALATEHGFALWVPFATVLRGWAVAEQGHNEQGIAWMRQGMEGWRATGAEVDRPYFLALLAEAYGRAGEVETALDLLAEGLALAQKYDEVYWEPVLHRLKGELLLTQAAGKGTARAAATRQSTLAEAETCFRQAIDVARRHQAKSLELRAVVSLSRLWQRQGKREEAQQQLAEIYGWFTEGFDTPDLQEAGAMLTELS